MKIFLGKMTKKILHFLAIAIIFIAFLIILTPLISYFLSQHAKDLEQLASQLLGMPVKISSVNISWHGYQPEINLNNVLILDPQSKNPILQVEDVGVLFSVLHSIWNLQLVPNGIIISGSHLNIHRNGAGIISIQGFPMPGGMEGKPFANETTVADAIKILSTQSRVILRNIHIQYSDFTTPKQFVTLYNLSLDNDDSKHLVLGKAILHQDIPTEIKIAIDWEGDEIDLSKIKARIYLYLSGVSLTQWLEKYSWQGWQVNEGIVSAKIWANWDEGAFKRIQVNFQTYGLDLLSGKDKKTHKINRLSGHLGWQQEGKNQIFAGEDILFDLPEHLWPVTNFYLLLSSNDKNILEPRTFKISYLHLEDVQSFLFSSPLLLPDDWDQILSQLKPQGGLQDVVIHFSTPWDSWQHLSFNANFSRLSFLPWKQLPGVRNISGAIKWANETGELLFHSNRLLFTADQVFPHPIAIDQLSGQAQWKKIKNEWLFEVPRLQLLNSDGAANIHGSLLISKNISPEIDLSGNFVLQKASHVNRYLPMKIFNANLVKWLNQAFLGGEVSSGNIELHGALNDFPFDHGEGRFFISGMVHNVDFYYASGWPRLKNIDGKLTFSNRQMLADIDRAMIYNIPLVQVHGEIPSLGGKDSEVLTVQADKIQTDFSQALKFVYASPLEETLGKMFSKMKISGPVQIKLGLQIPLNDPEKTKVAGAVTIDNSQLSLGFWGLSVSRLKGEVNFTENSTEAKNIQGQLFNKPIVIHLNTIHKTPDANIVQAKLNFNLDVIDLERWLKLPLTSVVQGSAAVDGLASFSLRSPTEIELRSDLQGVTMELPLGYGKIAFEKRNFIANFLIQENQPLRTKLSYGDLLSTALIFDRKDGKFILYGVNLRLGGGDPTWPALSGLYITGGFDKLTWQDIQKYMDQSHTTFEDLPLRAVDISTKSLDIFGQSIKQAHLQVFPVQRLWKININSSAVAGKISLPMKLTSEGFIEAQFERLNLGSNTQSQQATQNFNLKKLPSISLTVNDFVYNDMRFGRLTLKAVPGQEGMMIETLRLDSPYIEFQANGRWTYSNSSYLQGSATTENVSRFLNSLGVDASNFVSSDGQLNFNLNWKGAPYSPSLNNLRGQASINFGKGRIVDVGESTDAKMGLGRMLSVFSLQTIPRRLTFDFSDLFQKGYSFDSVKGDFAFQNSNAFTSNLRFDGPIAKVTIKGRIGLLRKDYEFILSVTPYVSSSLPVAAGFITGGPIGGAAALAVGTVLGSAISKAATYRYLVTGPWNNPAWKSMDNP